MYLSKKYNWNRWKRKKTSKISSLTNRSISTKKFTGTKPIPTKIYNGKSGNFFSLRSHSVHIAQYLTLSSGYFFVAFQAFRCLPAPTSPLTICFRRLWFFLQCQPQRSAGQSDKRKGCMNVHVRMHSSQYPLYKTLFCIKALKVNPAKLRLL